MNEYIWIGRGVIETKKPPHGKRGFSSAPRQRAKHKLLRDTFTIKIPVFLSYGKIGFEQLNPTIRKMRPSLYTKAITIKKVMDDNGWNQSQVAEYLGVSRVRVSQILKVLKLNQKQLDQVKKKGRLVAYKVKHLKV
jgi:predicted XRE-type DNA-binding protein